MLAADTRASSKLKIGLKAVDTTGPHQNGKHPLGPIPGSEDAHEDASYDYDLEEDAMRMDVGTEEEEKTEEAEMESEIEDKAPNEASSTRPPGRE